MADASHIGLIVDRVDFPVEEGKVREFARAIGSDDLLTVPPTFASVAAHWRDQAAMVAALDLDIRRVVVGASEWEYHSRVAIGDRLAGDRVVVAVVVKDTGMTLITLETRLRHGDGRSAVTQRDTVIEVPA